LEGETGRNYAAIIESGEGRHKRYMFYQKAEEGEKKGGPINVRIRKEEDDWRVLSLRLRRLPTSGLRREINWVGLSILS